VMSHGLRLILYGGALGLAGFLPIGRLFQSFLYGVTPTDPVTFGTGVVLVVAVAGMAAVAPAVRAAHVNPLSALRQE
jgi:putative ABC transport system permease protein